MKNKVAKVSLLCIIIVLMIFGFYQIAKYEIVNNSAKRYTLGASDFNTGKNTGTLVDGEQNPSKHTYNTLANIPNIWFCTNKYSTEYGSFSNAEYDEVKGNQTETIELNGGKTYTYKEDGYIINTNKLLKYNDKSNISTIYETYCIQKGGAFHRGTVYKPVTCEIEGVGKIWLGNLPVAVSYIITNYARKPSERQNTFWEAGKGSRLDKVDDATNNLLNSVFGNNQSGYLNRGNLSGDYTPNFIQEAKDYYEYDTQVRDKGLSPSNNTDIDKIKVEYNKETGEYTTGDLNITYTNGRYSGVAFSGISGIDVIGYDNSGKQVASVPIDKVILKKGAKYGNAQKPEYFEPNEGTNTKFTYVSRPNKETATETTATKVDTSIQIYPASGQDFKVVFKLSEYEAKAITKISLKIKFKYMLANGKFRLLAGYKPTDTNNVEHEVQAFIIPEAFRTLYKQELEIEVGKLHRTINLGGQVWEDVPGGKENLANGVYDSADKVIPNVKVSLYTSDGKLASSTLSASESGISSEDVLHRINPTYTDGNGKYQFDGYDASEQYYVTFEYNGQIYMPTTYNTSGQDTSKGTEFKNSRLVLDSRFSEIGSSPMNYETNNNLKLSNSVLTKVREEDGYDHYYNKSYSQYDLMGFELGEDGNYKQGTRLIDSFFEIKDGKITETDKIQEGLISQKIKDYVKEKKKYPDATGLTAIRRNIVKEIAEVTGDTSETWRKLQFIEDCKIISYTKPQAYNSPYDLYPTSTGKNEEHINQGLWRRQEADMALRKDIVYAATRINGKTEVYEYDKRSQMTDEERDELARLRAIYEQDRTNMDNYQAYLDYLEQIEGKYYWEIQLRMQDYNNYYASAYTRGIYDSDYRYRSKGTNESGKNLELYVTYKITVRNSSTSILSQITELVDYYDKDYTYMNDLSWIMYKNNSNGDNAEISLSKEDYYNTIDQLSLQGNLAANAKDITSKYYNEYNSSRYGSFSQQSGMEEEYNSVYISGLDDKKLASGEEAYIYLTFKVKSDKNGPVILDENDSLKQNYAEINGYKTYYADGTTLPNYGDKSSRDVAGIIDIDSTPGNLSLNDLKSNKYERNFEDDTDRAKSIKVTVYTETTDQNDKSTVLKRSINGTVWEDKRTQTVSNAVIGDGVRQDKEIGINGVNVELVEKLADDKEYVWQTTKTKNVTLKATNGKVIKKDGYYEFKNIIPGNYFIRFKYGDTDATVKTTSNGGNNVTSYNGQDFKSTVYQKDMNGQELAGYNETYYNIQASDAFGSNLSDAKDVWSRRKEVNNYCSNNGNGVTNALAEVLASPYTNTSEFTDEQKEAWKGQIKDLKTNTYMTAKTGIIVLEGEYNRTKTNGDNSVSNGSSTYLYGNDLNGKYTLNNVDFGLTERPKAQLELNKKVTNVKITLANGNTLIDTQNSATDIAWTKGDEYELNKEMVKNDNKDDKENIYINYYSNNSTDLTKDRYAYRTSVNNIVAKKYNGSNKNGLIQIDMDDEIMHGATIEISYELQVTNAGETDYTGKDFYYKGIESGDTVTTTADVVLDYVANNLQFRAEDKSNGGWSTVKDAVNDENLNNSLSNAVAKYNTIIKTEEFNSELNSKLKPGYTTSPVGLVLTQLLNPQNSSDNKTYNNIAEITKISNTVGRRMAYSIQGNQDPTTDPAEVDSFKAERVIIIPPTGIGEIVEYIALATGVLAILIGGIIFIKKKVLKK